MFYDGSKHAKYVGHSGLSLAQTSRTCFCLVSLFHTIAHSCLTVFPTMGPRFVGWCFIWFGARDLACHICILVFFCWFPNRFGIRELACKVCILGFSGWCVIRFGFRGLGCKVCILGFLVDFQTDLASRICLARFASSVCWFCFIWFGFRDRASRLHPMCFCWFPKRFGFRG